MTQTPTINRRIVLNARPNGAPAAEDFRLEHGAVPQPDPGQVLLRTLYLSLDPYMRGRMSDEVSYSAPMALGDVMVGGTVSRVEHSAHAGFNPAHWWWGQPAGRTIHWRMARGSMRCTRGTLTFARTGGARHAGLHRLHGGCWTLASRWRAKPSWSRLPAARSARWSGRSPGSRVAVSWASLAEEKCRYVVDELGFDDCIDHLSDGMPDTLAAACPAGIDVYFENVGGAVFDAVLPLLNTRSRIPVCGLISGYNATALPAGPDRLGMLEATLLKKRIRMQGFITMAGYGSRWNEFAGAMREWVRKGSVKVREDIVFGLENAPDAFMGLLQGRNFGKLIVQLAHE